jgi:hypothetical protein
MTRYGIVVNPSCVIAMRTEKMYQMWRSTPGTLKERTQKIRSRVGGATSRSSETGRLPECERDHVVLCWRVFRHSCKDDLQALTMVFREIPVNPSNRASHKIPSVLSLIVPLVLE